MMPAACPPPMPSWLDLVSKTPSKEEVAKVNYAELPCNRCGNANRVVYKSGHVDAYCKSCRTEVNRKSYEARAGRDIKVGGVTELHMNQSGDRKGPGVEVNLNR